MRILLTSNASYDPPRGGSTRSNLVWLRGLLTEGHQVRVVAAAWDGESDRAVEGIPIRGVKDLPLRTAALGEEINSFAPDLVLVSSEDLSHRLLHEAARVAPGRVVYLAHTPQFFPFGPESWNPDPKAASVVKEARAVVAIGRHMASYIERHASCPVAVVHPPIYGSAPFPQFGNFGVGDVLMINPCEVKGISIFLALAQRFARLPFTGLAGWGTTAKDRKRMAALPNVRVLESVPNIDDVLRRARLLLMPSLWYEGFGLIAMEAMLRGVPVIASDSGGLKEAKQGTEFVIPVRPIERYLPEFDEVHMPVPVIADQKIDPWATALQTLTGDNVVYTREAEQSRARATEFVSRIDPADLGRLLGSLHQEPLKAPRQPSSGDARRTLLAQKLRRRARD